MLNFGLKLTKLIPCLFSMLRFVEKKISAFRKVLVFSKKIGCFQKTFSGVYSNFSSFVALEHKIGLVYTVLHRSFTIVPAFSKFHFEVETLKKTLHKNAYPTKFVDKCITKFVNNIFAQKLVFTTVPKLELRLVLPYLGNISSITKKRLNRSKLELRVVLPHLGNISSITKKRLSRCISKRLKFCKLKIIFKTGNKLKNYFRFKDRVRET